jgi:hypothetical protein
MPTTLVEESVAKRIESFEISEASVRLEGVDPMSSPDYVAVRSRVIAGEISTDQAVELLLASYRKPHSAAA